MIGKKINKMNLAVDKMNLAVVLRRRRTVHRLWNRDISLLKKSKYCTVSNSNITQ